MAARSRPVHVIPEPLTGQRALPRGEQPAQDSASIPLVQRCFAGRGHTAVQGRQQHIVPAGQSLVSLGHLSIDQAHYIQFLGDLPERGQGTELDDLRLYRLGGRFAQPLEQLLCAAEMLQDDRAGFAVDASGLDDLPVGASAGDLFLDRGHCNQCIHLMGYWSSGKAKARRFPRFSTLSSLSQLMGWESEWVSALASAR